MRKLLAFFVALFIMIPTATNADTTGIIISGDSSLYNEYYGAVDITPGETIKQAGNYSLTLLNSYCLSDSMIQDGLYFVYLTTLASGGECERWQYKRGVQTPLYIGIECTNRSNENTNWLNRIKCVLVYDDKYTFDVSFVTQWNLGQTDKDGKKRSSIVAIDTEPLMKGECAFSFNVPLIVRDSTKPLVAFITVDDTDTYRIDVRSSMIILDEKTIQDYPNF